jgi:hypothetical protein
MNFGMGIRSKHRKAFDRFLDHPNPRVREYALNVKSVSDAAIKEWRDAIAMDELMAEEFWNDEVEPQEGADLVGSCYGVDEPIPF